MHFTSARTIIAFLIALSANKAFADSAHLQQAASSLSGGVNGFENTHFAPAPSDGVVDLKEPQVAQFSMVEYFQKCLDQFQYALQDLSPEERQQPLALWCSKVLFGDYDDDEDSMLIGAEKRSSRNQFLHFGKRSRRDTAAVGDEKDKKGGRNKMLHFGKRANGDTVQENGVLLEDEINELVKRAGQNRMMHFGKRAPNRFMHFGKRGPQNKFMHFGKRADDSEDEMVKRASNKFMHFGKRDDEETDAVVGVDDEMIKRGPNKFMHFGKRGSNRYLHFGKRDFSEADEDELTKRAGNRYLHFGKRPSNRYLHFGKRPDDQVLPENEANSDSSTYALKRKRRSIISDLDGEMGNLDMSGFIESELRAPSEKRMIAYPSLPLQQVLLRHRMGLIDKDEQEDKQPIARSYLGSEDLLDRIGRSEQFQMTRPRVRSRWARPDKNVFLHFG